MDNLTTLVNNIQRANENGEGRANGNHIQHANRNGGGVANNIPGNAAANNENPRIVPLV